MKTNKVLRATVILAIVLLNIGLDQVTKHLVRNHVYPYTTRYFLNGHLMLTRVENTGAFLSLGDQIPNVLRIILLSVIPAAVLIWAISQLIRRTDFNRLSLIGLCCIVGGGAGNVYDRVVNGSVTDFLYINYSIFHTGVFNLADLSITGGVLTVLISLRRKLAKEQKVAVKETA